MWNVENYILDALKSIKRQSVQDYEVICVDDGSTDNTVNVCEKYLKENFKYYKLIQIEHSGVSIARNVALDNINGEYVFFLDSDDIILNNNIFEKLLFKIENYNCDVVFGKFFNTKGKHSVSINNNNLIDSKTVINNVIINKTHYNPSTYFCKSSILKDIRFIEHIFMEDMVFLIDILINSNTVYFSNIITICKRVRPGAVTNSDGKYDYYNCIALDLILEKLKFVVTNDIWKSYVINSNKFILDEYIKITNKENRQIYMNYYKKFKEKYNLT